MGVVRGVVTPDIKAGRGGAVGGRKQREADGQSTWVKN